MRSKRDAQEQNEQSRYGGRRQAEGEPAVEPPRAVLDVRAEPTVAEVRVERIGAADSGMLVRRLPHRFPRASTR